MVLPPIQLKIQVLKVSEFAPSCANEYAKEKEKEEKNTTIFTKKLWGGISDYERLFTLYYTCIISHQRVFYIVRDFYSRLMCNSWFLRAFH